MAFFTVEHRHYLANYPDTCKASLTRLSGRKNGKVGLRLVMGRELLNAMGGDRGDRFRLMWGNGQDVGSVYVSKTTDGSGSLASRDSGTVSDVATAVFANMPRDPIVGHGITHWVLPIRPQPAVIMGVRK